MVVKGRHLRAIHFSRIPVVHVATGVDVIGEDAVIVFSVLCAKSRYSFGREKTGWGLYSGAPYDVGLR